MSVYGLNFKIQMQSQRQLLLRPIKIILGSNTYVWDKFALRFFSFEIVCQ